MRDRIVVSAISIAALFGSVHAACAAVPAPTPDATPAGIVATSETLGNVLRRHAIAMTPAAGAPTASRERWSLDEAGRVGTETILRRGDDYHSVLERDGTHEEYGKLGKDGWHLDANGVVSPSDREDDDSFSMQRVLEDASDPKNDVKLLGAVASPAAYVVEVRRPFDTHPKWVFFDRATGYVVRTEHVTADGQRVTNTYDDYRPTDGFARPWHIVDEFPKTGITFSYRLLEHASADDLTDASFAPPDGRFKPGVVTQSEIVPSSIKLFSVVVRVTVAGRGLDFELSTGSPRSYIDRQVAIELGLPTFGQPVRDAKGEPLGFDTVLGDASVGSMTVHDFALRAVDIAYEPSEDTKIVGVLGSDFLRSGIFTIDFVNNQVEVAPNTTSPVSQTDDALVIPVRFDAGEPYVSATIGEHATAHALIDNAFPFTTIVGSFSNKYPDSVPDDNGKARHRGNLPFADDQTYGRNGTVWISKVASLDVAGLQLQKYAVLATDMGADSTTDVIIGMNYLSLFDVQLDFVHGRILLHKNKYFHAIFQSATR